MSKRQKFVAISVFLSFGLLAVQLVRFEIRYQAIALLSFLSGLLSVWALHQDLNKIEWLTTLILPVTYTAASGLFYFLLPERWLSRLLIVGFFGITFYALLLTENIFAVAAMRTIQLLRAAQTVGFLLTLVSAFFLFDTVFSLRLPFYFNFLLAGMISFLLTLQSLWSVKLEEKITPRVFIYSLVFSFILGQFALAISFWPVTVATGSLFLTTVLYVLLGMSQEHFKERLFQKTIKEYLWVGAIIFWVTFFIAHWGG